MDECPDNVRISSPVSKSHSLMMSSPALARSSPSELRATDRTNAECPARVRISLPELRSHTLMVWSSLPLTIHSPVGLKAMEVTPAYQSKPPSECPVKVCTHLQFRDWA